MQPTIRGLKYTLAASMILGVGACQTEPDKPPVLIGTVPATQTDCGDMQAFAIPTSTSVEDTAETCERASRELDSRKMASIAAMNAARLYADVAETSTVESKKVTLGKVLRLLDASEVNAADSSLGDAELEKKFSSDRKVIRADALLSAGLLIDGVTNCGGEEPCLEKGIKAYGKVSDPSAGLVIKWAKAKSAFAVKRNSSAGVETAINELKQLGISDSVKASKARAAIVDIALEHCSTMMTSTVSRCEATFLSEAREVAYGDPNLRGQYAGLSLKYADALSYDANRNTTDTLQKSEDLCQAANAYLDSVRIDGLEDFEKAHAYEWRADALAFLHDSPSSTCKPDGVSAGLQQAALDSYLSARANRNNSARGMKSTSVTTFAKLLNTAGLSNPGNLTVAKLFGEVGNVTATTTSTAQREQDMLELLTSIKRSPNVSDLRQAKNRFGEFPHPHLELGKFLIRTSNSSTTSEVKSLFAEANRLASPGNKYPEVAAEANYLLSVIEMRAIDSTNPVQTGEAVRTAERAVEFDPSKVSYLNQACKAHLQYQRKEFGGDRACNRVQSVGEGAILKAMTKYRKAQIARKGGSQTNSHFREAEEAFEQIAVSGSFVGADGIAYDSRQVVELGRVLSLNCGIDLGGTGEAPTQDALEAKMLFELLGLNDCDGKDLR